MMKGKKNSLALLLNSLHGLPSAARLVRWCSCLPVTAGTWLPGAYAAPVAFVHTINYVFNDLDAKVADDSKAKEHRPKPDEG